MMNQFKVVAAAAVLLFASTSAMAVREVPATRNHPAGSVIDVIMNRDASAIRDSKEQAKIEKKRDKELRKQAHERDKDLRKRSHERDKELRKAERERAKDLRKAERERAKDLRKAQRERAKDARKGGRK